MYPHISIYPPIQVYNSTNEIAAIGNSEAHTRSVTNYPCIVFTMHPSTDVMMGHPHQRSTPPPHIPLMNSTEQPTQRSSKDSERSIEIDGSTDLSLFRSHSMPIPNFAGEVGPDHHSFQGSRPAEDPNQEEDEEEEDDEDFLATPPFIPPPIKHLSSNQRLLSCSLPPSLDRRKTNSSHAHHENPLDEFFQLTQPMREGLISREKLLPSSRMKQVGIGGRGRRASSNRKMAQNLYSPTSGSITTEQDSVHLPSPVKYDQTMCSPGSSTFMHQQSMNNVLSSSTRSTNSMIVHSQVAQVPLLRPRPILAWDHPSRPFLPNDIPVSNLAESNYEIIK